MTQKSTHPCASNDTENSPAQAPVPETTQEIIPEIIYVAQDADSVKCDGGHGSLGHPAVYYRFDGQERLTCGYCDREFVKHDD